MYCSLSPTLFSLYTEELAARDRIMNAGVRVGDDKICMLLYADDVIMELNSGGAPKYTRRCRGIWERFWSEV